MGPLAALPVPLSAVSGRHTGAHPDDPLSSDATACGTWGETIAFKREGVA